MAKLLLVEGDIVLANMLTNFLKKESYTVEHTVNGDIAIEMMLSYDFDAVIIDWDLPGKSGPEIISEYRSKGGEAGLLMLTAKDSIADKTVGFNVGSDDYLTKPFHPSDLSLRIKSLIRRNSKQKYRVGSLELDPTAHTVRVAGEKVELTSNEFRLLELLMRYPDQVMTTEKILNRVWPSESEITVEAVRICITRIRKKIGQSKECPTIVNVYGEGYALRLRQQD